MILFKEKSPRLTERACKNSDEYINAAVQEILVLGMVYQWGSLKACP